MNNAGRILIVDDSKTVRIKLKKATEALGHDSVTVGSGPAALEQLAKEAFDLVLLDIMMPEMDGFEVLKALKSSRATHDLPVIVISALDEEMSSVIKAIELGAEDFLPKDFELALLGARLSTCIEKKRLRDIEKEYFRQVSKLTRAATTLELGTFNPVKLGIQDVASRQDGLGRLAKVFSTMAQTVYERERKLKQNIRTFRGGLLLLACGTLYGLGAPLSKMVSMIATHPLGLAVLVDLIGAIVCIGIALYQNTMPKLGNIKPAEWRYIVQFAIISSVINQVLVYWMASKLPAFIVAIVIVLEGFVVFAYAALMGIETPKLKRLAGLAMGLAGILVIIVYNSSNVATGSWLWFIVALAIPLTYGVEDIYIATSKPAGINNIALYGLTLVVATLMLAPLAAYFDDFIPLNLLYGRLGLLTVIMALAYPLATILFMVLIASTGAVFASQSGYVITAAGIGWSIILLGEYIPPFTWAALGLIVVGLIMVEPKHEAEEEPPPLGEIADDLAI